jgi:hypothetical protein
MIPPPILATILAAISAPDPTPQRRLRRIRNALTLP